MSLCYVASNGLVWEIVSLVGVVFACCDVTSPWAPGPMCSDVMKLMLGLPDQRQHHLESVEVQQDVG